MSGNAVGIDLFWGNGDGTLQPAEFFSSGAESGLPAVGDLNGDGRPDFALGNTFFGVITMLNTGVASFSPTSPLVFRAQLINTKSATQVVTLKNSGTGILSIQSIKASAQFQVSDTCGSSLLVGASCAIKAAFDPTNGGAHSGVITIIDSASSKPQFIQLSGSGTVFKTSPGSLKFGNVTVGSKSAPLPVIVTNEGGDPIQFASLYVGGTDKKDFSQTDSCLKRALQPAASCTVNVTFAPTQSGALSAQLYISLQKRRRSRADPSFGNGHLIFAYAVLQRRSSTRLLRSSTVLRGWAATCKSEFRSRSEANSRPSQNQDQGQRQRTGVSAPHRPDLIIVKHADLRLYYL
jgi:hypothetical protein